jgi:hypothetical protein
MGAATSATSIKLMGRHSGRLQRPNSDGLPRAERYRPLIGSGLDCHSPSFTLRQAMLLTGERGPASSLAS